MEKPNKKFDPIPKKAEKAIDNCVKVICESTAFELFDECIIAFEQKLGEFADRTKQVTASAFMRAEAESKRRLIEQESRYVVRLQPEAL